jgi:4-alpha-glucanotransferase
VYTGTHDNDTTLSWFEALDAEQQQHIYDYLGFPEIPMPLALIRSALASDARLSMVPMQDLLGLGKGYRMNTPGTLSDDNWRWRFCWAQVEEARTRRVADWLRLYGRAGGDPRNQSVRRLAGAAKPVLRSGPG